MLFFKLYNITLNMLDNTAYKLIKLNILKLLNQKLVKAYKIKISKIHNEFTKTNS